MSMKYLGRALRHPHRRGRQHLSAPRERDRAERGGDGRAVRRRLAPRRAPDRRRREDVEVEGQLLHARRRARAARRPGRRAVPAPLGAVPQEAQLHLGRAGGRGGGGGAHPLGRRRASTRSPRRARTKPGAFAAAERAEQFLAEFAAAMDDDLNTSEALGVALHVPARGQRRDRRRLARRRRGAAPLSTRSGRRTACSASCPPRRRSFPPRSRRRSRPATPPASAATSPRPTGSASELAAQGHRARGRSRRHPLEEGVERARTALRPGFPTTTSTRSAAGTPAAPRATSSCRRSNGGWRRSASRTTSRSTSCRESGAIRGSRCGRTSSTATSREVEALREEFRGRIAVRLGLEADYAEGHEETLAALARARADWDLVLGSVHWVDGRLDRRPGTSAARFEQEGTEPLYDRVLPAAREGGAQRPLRRPDALRSSEEIRPPARGSPRGGGEGSDRGGAGSGLRRRDLLGRPAQARRRGLSRSRGSSSRSSPRGSR